MGSLSRTDEPVLPIHVGSGRGNEQNLIYCRKCRHRLGGVYGAIAGGVCDWRFCPYCGVEIAQASPYHQPVEIVMERPRWPLFSCDPLKSWPPEMLDGVVDGIAREQQAPALPATTALLPAPLNDETPASTNGDGRSLHG